MHNLRLIMKGWVGATQQLLLGSWALDYTDIHATTASLPTRPAAIMQG